MSTSIQRQLAVSMRGGRGLNSKTSATYSAAFHADSESALPLLLINGA
jgi:hypothetical protein